MIESRIIGYYAVCLEQNQNFKPMKFGVNLLEAIPNAFTLYDQYI